MLTLTLFLRTSFLLNGTRLFPLSLPFSFHSGDSFNLTITAPPQINFFAAILNPREFDEVSSLSASFDPSHELCDPTIASSFSLSAFLTTKRSGATLSGRVTSFGRYFPVVGLCSEKVTGDFRAVLEYSGASVEWDWFLVAVLGFAWVVWMFGFVCGKGVLDGLRWVLAVALTVACCRWGFWVFDGFGGSVWGRARLGALGVVRDLAQITAVLVATGRTFKFAITLAMVAVAGMAIAEKGGVIGVAFIVVGGLVASVLVGAAGVGTTGAGVKFRFVLAAAAEFGLVRLVALRYRTGAEIAADALVTFVAFLIGARAEKEGDRYGAVGEEHAGELAPDELELALNARALAAWREGASLSGALRLGQIAHVGTRVSSKTT
jgi:hypothetical protein